MRREILAILSFLMLLGGTGSLQVCSRESLRGLEDLRAIRTSQRLEEPDHTAIMLDRSIAHIPAGSFRMGTHYGDEDQRPQHIVYLDSFEIDRFEVTNLQYQRFLDETGFPPPRYWEGDKHPPGLALLPVVGVSWRQATAYCEWAGKRLPTEAEWERACKGPRNFAYPWGMLWDPRLAQTNWKSPNRWPDDPDQTWSWLSDGDLAGTIPQPVGSYPNGRSSEGVFDLAGNASEWVLDWYSADAYSTLASENPVAEGPPWNHAVRGSAWFDSGIDFSSAASLSRCVARNASHSYDDPRIGFRCARNPVR